MGKYGSRQGNIVQLSGSRSFDGEMASMRIIAKWIVQC